MLLGKGVVGKQKRNNRGDEKVGKERTDMKQFMRTGTAVVLTSFSIVISGLCPVQAESTGSGNNLVKESFVENGTAPGENAEGSGSAAAGTDAARESGSAAAGTDAAREQGDDAAGRGMGEAEPGDDSTERSLDDSGTVSGGDGAAVSGSCAEPDGIEDTQEAGREDADDGSSTDTEAGTDNNRLDGDSKGDRENGEDGAGGGSSDEGISPHDLTVYPDDRLMQWNMGNSSGKYGNSFDTYAVFDDNVIAALYGLGNDTYRLELTGTGEMAGLGYYDYQPYKAYRKKIVSVTVGEGITNVGHEAFARFSNLQEYTLPASVKTIGESAFEYCTSLKAVVIPDTVDSLSDYCFQYCEGAESLTIPGDMEYNGLNIPFYGMKNLKDIYITPGKTGTAGVSQVVSPVSSPACTSDGYTIHFMEGVTEIHDKIFANTKASRIEIADSVTVIGTDAFAKKAYDTSTIPDYIILGDNTRNIASNAFMASIQTITPTTVEIGNVYQYEYDWAAVRREVTFVVRLNALRELSGMVENDMEGWTLAGRYPADKWKELQDELAAAKKLVAAGSGDLNLITGSFIRLYDLYHYELKAVFIVTVPAEVVLTDDVENNRVIGFIPVTIKHLVSSGLFTLYMDGDSFVMRDKQSGRILPLEFWEEDLPVEDSTGSEARFNLWLAGERLAGDWEGTVRMTISTHD